MSEELEIEITEQNQPYWQSLDKGVLSFQKCNDCKNCWLPARDFCPKCLSENWQWTASSGKGTVISWVVFHSAMNPAFKDRVPYNVAIVELAEGPRLITNLLMPNQDIRPRMAVKLNLERRHNVNMPFFSSE